MGNKLKFMLLFCLATVALYVMLTLVTIKDGGVILSIFVAWLASPVLFFVLAFLFESASVERGGRGNTVREVLGSVFSHEKQAWSFIYGDLILLPLAFSAAADKWSQVSDRSGLTPVWWLVCLALGCVAGASFHYKLDKPGYTKLGYVASLNSPTKLFHDFVSYPVLFGGLLFVYGPLVIATWVNIHTIVILGLVGAWFYLGAKLDSDRAKDLVPWGHPPFDMKEMRILQKS